MDQECLARGGELNDRGPVHIFKSGEPVNTNKNSQTGDVCTETM